MKKFLFYLLLIIMFSCPALADTGYPKYTEGEVLVVINAPEASDYSVMGTFNRNTYSRAVSNQAEAFARSVGLESRNTYPEIARISGKNIIYIRSENKSTNQLIRELSYAPEVISVSPNYIDELNIIPNDQYYNQQWGMNKIGMPQVWDYSKGSKSLCVAVLDTGIDYNHVDLNANMAIDSFGNYGRRFYNQGTVSSNAMDIDGHGTHVAGIIGAVGNNYIGVVGVNWSVNILNVNVFTAGAGSNGGPGAHRADVINGINYVIAEKNNGLNIRVVNMSLGGYTYNHPYELAIKSLSDSDIICVMSAGNDSINLNANGAPTHYPSSYRFDNTIAVGAMDSNNTISNFSNYGSQWVDIGAPGGSIYSTLPNNKYGYMSGTSMAAPHVAGAAALLCSVYSTVSVSHSKERIEVGANKNYGISQGYWSQGVLDVWKALIIPVFVTKSLPGAIVGTPYNQFVTVYGIAPITYQFSSGSLPTGLSFSSSGWISGTPTTAGTYNFAISAQNTGGIATKTLSIVVSSLPTITTSSLPGGTVGTAYSQALSATGTTPIYWPFYIGSLPTGLSLNSSGVISGTPTTAGTYNFTVSAQNPVGYGTKSLSIVVSSLPTITTSSLPGGTVGTAYNQTLNATGTAPIYWSLYSGSLPTGLILDAITGAIFGTPTTAGTYNFTVSAQNVGGSDTKALSIVINANPTITTTSLPGGTVGTAYSQTLSVAGTAPITWSISSGSLPTGLSLNSSTGAISGTPTTAGTYNFTVYAQNPVGYDTKSLSIAISNSGVVPVTDVDISYRAGGYSYAGGDPVPMEDYLWFDFMMPYRFYVDILPPNATNKGFSFELYEGNTNITGWLQDLEQGEDYAEFLFGGTGNYLTLTVRTDDGPSVSYYLHVGNKK
jgi:subtilisin family serine protease